jgi:hypothetical protein
MDSSTLLAIAGFFFFLGAGIVSLVWILVALARSIRRKGSGSASRDPNLTVITSLMRDNTTKELVVEMEGNTYKNVQELSASQIRRLSFTSSVLAKWLGLTQSAEAPAAEGQPASDTSLDAAEAAFAVAAAEAAWPEDKPVTPEPPVISSLPGTTEPPIPEVLPVEGMHPVTPTAQTAPNLNDWIPAEDLPDQSTTPRVPPFFYEPEPEVKPVSTKIPDLVNNFLTPASLPPPPPKSIAMQINDILQEKLVGTPFENRGITVNDGPDHGVIVTVDDQKFSGVKEVPDEEVRNLIRSAVLDWEKQNKLGLK